MNYKKPLIQPEQVEQAILLIRGQRVMLDRDLAALYGVTTGNLNKAVQRNSDRFPADFMFQLTADEAEALSFHFGSLKRGQHFKYLPCVFTQEGVAMLSSVLRSPRAVQVNIAIMRVFVRCAKRWPCTRTSPATWRSWSGRSKAMTRASAICLTPSASS